MKTRALSTLTVGALVTLTLVTGCATDPRSNPTPTYAATTPSTEEIQAASEAAETALRSWYQTSVQCLADPLHTDPSCFDQVSVDQVLQDDRETLATAREYEFRYVGDITVVSMEVGDIDLENTAQIEVTACVDPTNFRAVDADGTPVLPPDESRPDRYLVTYQVRNYAYPSATRWRVGQPVNQDVFAPC